MAGRHLAGAGGRLATSVRVDRTEKEAFCTGGFHHHVTALETEGGVRLRIGPVIGNVRLGAATYHIVVSDSQVDIEVRESCPRCSRPYLASVADDARHRHLLEMPDIGRPAVDASRRTRRARGHAIGGVGIGARARAIGSWLGASARSRSPNPGQG